MIFRTPTLVPSKCRFGNDYGEAVIMDHSSEMCGGVGELLFRQGFMITTGFIVPVRQTNLTLLIWNPF